jgi:hypothetical protein
MLVLYRYLCFSQAYLGNKSSDEIEAGYKQLVPGRCDLAAKDRLIHLRTNTRAHA